MRKSEFIHRVMALVAVGEQGGNPTNADLIRKATKNVAAAADAVGSVVPFDSDDYDLMPRDAVGWWHQHAIDPIESPWHAVEFGSPRTICGRLLANDAYQFPDATLEPTPQCAVCNKKLRVKS